MTRLRRTIQRLNLCILLLCSHACRSTSEPPSGSDSELQSEIDSFTPHSLKFDPEASRKALTRLDEITNIYLGEAIAWANRQPSCDGMCMAIIVSETLAASQEAKKVDKKLADIRAGKPFKRWTFPPEVPGWRGYQGAIEPLLSKGKSTDGRFTMDKGLIRLPTSDSIFQGIGRVDSPGAFVEVGTILPFEYPEDKQQLFIGSDKFGHFLSTGLEYLEAYQETYVETVKASLSPEQADERALFATLVRGVLTEVTTLGGWVARVYSFADLSTNFDGFLFFKAIRDGKSPYFSLGSNGKWKLTEHRFTWSELIKVSWDEGHNCSHYFASVNGTNQFAQKIVAQLIVLNKSFKQDFVCPIRADSCQSIASSYQKSFGDAYRKSLISPQCLEFAEGRRDKIEFAESDTKKNREGLDAMGFYSGETITKMMKDWCVQQREALVAKRCESLMSKYPTIAACVSKVERVTSEKFRCQMDIEDFLGWAL